MDPTELPFTQPKFPPMNESGTDFPESQSPVPCPNPADLDELFSEEHGQLLSLSGLRTSESLLLQELDAYAPKNADGTTQIPWSQRDFVDIDESIWFKVFRREKWTNYDLAIPGFSENKFDVDDEFFWGRLRRSIELANRMLGEALRHTWLASFLTKSSREARESVSTTTDGKRHPNSTIYRVVPVPPDARQSVEAATAVLDEISEHVFWGFHHRNEYPDVLGKTLAVPWEGGKTLYWCTLDVVMLRGLIAGDTPWDGEGRQAAFNVAVIMLHELMHAISKHLLLEITNKQADRCRCWELFFDEERWAEAGISFEMSFFGTCLRNAWPLSRSPRHAFQALRGPHPWMNGQFQYYGGWSFDDPFVEDKFGLPGSIPVAMSTKDFWECQVSRFGAESLRLDRGVVTVAGFEFGKMRGVRTGRAKLLEGGGMEETEMIAERIRLRRLKLRELRPWYATEYAKWCETPFAERQMRSLLASLQRLCVGRSVKHESGILAIIPKLIFPFVTTSDLRTATTNDERISRWFFRAVGYLVLATLPVRKVVETWIEQTVPEYPDRLRPSRDFAGPPGFLEAVTEKGRKKKDKQRTKTIGVHGRAVHDRELCLANARFAFLKWRMCGVVCAELAKEFESELRAMRVRLDMRPLDNVWMEFDFRMPEYEGTVYYPPGLESKEKTHHDEQDADMPSWAIASTGIAIRVRQDDVMRYFTPAEIGDHQGLQSKVKWVLHPSPDGLEVDVYDAGDFLPNNTWDAASRARIVVPGPEGQPAGRVLRPGVLGQGQIKELISKPPLGRAMLWRREEDVRINDGREGRPKWISVGADVFDVTNLQLPPYMHELGQMLSCASGGNPVAQAIDRGYHPDLILEHLRQYQIGWVRDEVSGPRRKDRIFTADEVRWHAFPEVGMYLIIHDRVYDFTEYCGMHPGGKAILEEFAGRDATAAWNQAHAHNQSDFGIDIHAGLDMLCIGRVVPGQSDKQELSASQIRIRDLIFSRDKLTLEQAVLLDPLANHWGSDCTSSLEKQELHSSLVTLWKSRDLVSAKVVTAPTNLPVMTWEVLRKMKGIEITDAVREAYISDGTFVYNMTSFIRFSPPSLLIEMLKLKCGQSLTASADEAQLRDWLQSNCQYRIIARYSRMTWGDSTDWKMTAHHKPDVPQPGESPDIINSLKVSRTWAQVLQGDANNPGPKSSVRPIQQTTSSDGRQRRRGAQRGEIPGAQSRGENDGLYRDNSLWKKKPSANHQSDNGNGQGPRWPAFGNNPGGGGLWSGQS